MPVFQWRCFSDNAGGADDWVEIHNLGSSPVNLAGYYLTDRLNNPTKWRFPLDAGDSTVVEPNGYVVLWADEEGIKDGTTQIFD